MSDDESVPSGSLDFETSRVGIVVKPAAAGEIESIDQRIRRQLIVGCVERPALAPRPRGREGLSGRMSRSRLRRGDCRILDETVDEERLVDVVEVAHGYEADGDATSTPRESGAALAGVLSRQERTWELRPKG